MRAFESAKNSIFMTRPIIGVPSFAYQPQGHKVLVVKELPVVTLLDGF